MGVVAASEVALWGTPDCANKRQVVRVYARREDTVHPRVHAAESGVVLAQFGGSRGQGLQYAK